MAVVVRRWIKVADLEGFQATWVVLLTVISLVEPGSFYVDSSGVCTLRSRRQAHTHLEPGCEGSKSVDWLSKDEGVLSQVALQHLE
jgi:hypothetical protein